MQRHLDHVLALTRTTCGRCSCGLSRWKRWVISRYPPPYNDVWCKADVVELLLRKGANVNAKTTEGETALHVAAEMGFTKALMGVGDAQGGDAQGAMHSRRWLHSRGDAHGWNRSLNTGSWASLPAPGDAP